MKGGLSLLIGVALGAGATAAWVNRRQIAGYMAGHGPLGLEPGPVVDPTSMAGSAIRQLRRYAFASAQDKSPIVGITHASYALVLLDTLEEVMGRDAIKKAGYDPVSIRAWITKIQDRHAEMLKPSDPYLQQALAVERGEGGQLPGFVFADAGAAPRGA